MASRLALVVLGEVGREGLRMGDGELLGERRRGLRAEQGLREVIAAAAQLVERAAQLAVADAQALAAPLGRYQGGAAQQLADERRAGALELGDDGAGILEVELEPLAIEGEQPRAPFGVGQRELDGLVDAARP
jgi:hypothetical protein